MEDINTDYLSIARKHNNYCSVPTNSAIQKTHPSYVPIEMNHDHHRSVSTYNSLEDALSFNVPIVIDYDHSRLESANSTIKDMHRDDLIGVYHNHYRFAYDLVENVLEIRGDLNPNVSHNLPEPQNYLFTDKHRIIVKTLLKTDTAKLKRGISNISNGIYTYESYLICRDFFVEQSKNRVCTEKSFIGACATIAYVAAHFIQVNYYSGALDDVVYYIACWIGDILVNETIDNSCWRPFK